MKKIISVLCALCTALSLFMPVSADASTLSDDIVILYTNDIHTYIDGPLSYDTLAAIKQDLQKQYKHVILADAGDHIQGTAYGSMDQGETMIKLMNAAKYDVATLGNHEFDYGMDGCMKTIESADFPYVSANFYTVENGNRKQNVLDSFVMFDCGNEKLAFVGITTPETFEKSTSAYFRDENGNFIYGISGGEDGTALQNDVQAAIDEAKAQGATKIIALGHLGIDPSSTPWTSRETIGAVTGLDAFIDGHSHSVVESENVSDKNGAPVILTQTGNYFDRVGMMVIDDESDKITTGFITFEETESEDGSPAYHLSSSLYNQTEQISDATVKVIKDGWVTQIDTALGEKIGCAEIVLDNYDVEQNRLVRSTETNSGDFAADALYYLFDNLSMPVDVAIMNGGGVRNVAVSGDISYKTCKDIHTFGNVACLQKVSGQQIKDALEWGARKTGIGENGGFLQVAGMTYKINTAIADTVKEDEVGTWIAPPDAYRVYDIKIYNKETNTYDPLVLDKEYHLAGYNYTLRNLGDGYAMFDGAVNVLDYVMEDYMVLANYVKGFENGIIGATNSPLRDKYPGMLLNYGATIGSGRIEIADVAKSQNTFSDIQFSDWFCNDVTTVTENGWMNGVSHTIFAPFESVTRGMAVTVLHRLEGAPAVIEKHLFADVTSDDYFSAATEWAAQADITSGVTNNLFAPFENLTREQMAAMLYRYAQYKNVDVSCGEDTNILSYSDAASVSEYAQEAFCYAVGAGIIQGKTESTLNPQDTITRAETATILCRFIKNLNN